MKIETEKEINTIAQATLKKLIVASNEASKVHDNSKDLGVQIKEIEEHIDICKSDLKKKKAELLDAGFLRRGGVKKEVNKIEADLESFKTDLSKTKRAPTSVNKKLTSIREIKSIESGSEEFVLLYTQAFPNEKKPSKTLKSRISLNVDFSLKTYRQVFDETWDKKIEIEINKLKKEDLKQKEIQKIKEKGPTQSKRSKKEQLLELQELLDETLISNGEFEASRKKILGLQ